MSSMYSPITILDPTTHIENTQHWPHVQWVQSYHYFRPHHPHTEHTTLTTCPVRTLQSLFQTPPPTYRTHNTDHMSSMYSPITILDPTIHIHIWNTQHWPRVQYVQSYHYFRPHHPHMEHTTLTTCPVSTFLSLFQTPPPTYRTHNTDHMSSTYTPITISDPTTHIQNTQHWPHVQYVQSYHYFRPHHPHPHMEQTTLTTCPVCTVLSLY